MTEKFNFDEALKAIQTIFPKAEVQLCIVHQIRNSLRYVASKHHKEFMVDLKRVCKALNKEAAESTLDDLEEKWTMPIQNWGLTLSQLAIFFEGRLDGALDL